MTPLEADRFAQHVIGLIKLNERVTDNTSISDVHVTDDRGGTGDFIVTFASNGRFYRRTVAPTYLVERILYPSKENKDD